MIMKTGFKDPIAPRKVELPKAVMPNKAFSFKCPDYDQRASCFVQGGTDYGTGFAQPIGSKGECKAFSDALPMGRVETMRFKPK